MSELAHKLIEENKKTKATILDLGNCGLTALPEELKDLSWLEELRLGYDYFDFENKNWVTTRNKGKSNKIPVLPQWIGELVNLQSLALNDISLETVEALGLLRALRVINVSNSEVSDLNPLKNLANLQLLYCSSTQVSDLNPLKNLANLQLLYCSSTQVSDLNPLKNHANLQQLDCSFTQVSDLNPLKNLANLQLLYCSYTQVSDLNPLKSLANLQLLYCSSTQVSDLNPLKNHANLQQLDCSSTQVSDLNPLKNLANLQLFNCSSTQVSDLNPLKNLANLQDLNCSSTQVSDLNPLKNLANLQDLNCSSTQVSDLNPLKNLANLQQLYCSSTQVSDLNPLKNLANLQLLYCSFTQVSDLNPLKNHANLQQLDCSSTQVSDLNPLKNLANLQQIDCSSTQVSDLNPLKNLANLQQLYCSSTQVSDLNPLKNLANMQLLYCSSTQVSDLNPLKNHANLQQLDCSSTQVSDLNPLKNLANLQLLDCSSTQVSDLNPLKNLANLQLLDCSSTQVSDLNPLKNLANLLHLDCRSTQVSDLNPLKNRIENGLPVHWKEGDGIGIFIKDSPLDKSLIAAIKAGNEAVIKYLNKPKERLWEARVLVLGEPRAGKTTLRRKLKSPTAAMPTDVESTKGIEIEIETYKCRLQKDNVSYKMQYYLWDFGGQDMYRLLHQLFVSEQAIYIIVTDTDRNKNEEEIDFWLETIQRLGRDKNGKYGPVILLQNPKTNREGGSFPDLKKRYSELWRQSDDFVINLNKIAKGTEGFDRMELERFNYFIKYLENSFHQLDHLGQEMPRAWVRIRRALVKQTVNNWITLEAFRSVCEKENIRNSSEQEDLLKIFHILGFVLHYDTGSLRGMVILNKEWATDALYRVLDDEIVKSNEGWFFKSDAKKIWHDTKYQDRENELLLLMQEFKLCYFNETSQKYIVPSKLPEDTEGLPEWDTNNNVRLFLRYDWLPRPVATQLIVLLHDHIVQINDQKQWIWRKGAVLDGKKLDLMDAQVRILDNWRERQIEIYARGKSSEYLIRTLMQHWRIVHEPYEDKVEVQKIILCNCDTCQSLNKPFEFDYQEVLDAREAREPLRCNKSRKDLSATDILRGVFDETTVLVDSISAKGGRSELLDLIAAGELGQALDRLPNSETLLALKARYNNLHDQQLRGVIHAEAYRVEWNQLVDILIVYLNTNNFQRGKYVPIFKDGNLSEDYMVPTRGFDGKPSIQYNFSIHGGQVNIADEIGKVRFSPELGVSKADFESLKKQFQNLSAAQQDSLKTLVVEEPEATTEIEKTSIGNKIVALLNDNAIPILQNLTASAYYDLIKLFLDV